MELCPPINNSIAAANNAEWHVAITIANAGKQSTPVRNTPREEHGPHANITTLQKP